MNFKATILASVAFVASATDSFQSVVCSTLPDRIQDCRDCNMGMPMTVGDYEWCRDCCRNEPCCDALELECIACNYQTSEEKICTILSRCGDLANQYPDICQYADFYERWCKEPCLPERCQPNFYWNAESCQCECKLLLEDRPCPDHATLDEDCCKCKVSPCIRRDCGPDLFWDDDKCECMCELERLDQPCPQGAELDLDCCKCIVKPL